MKRLNQIVRRFARDEQGMETVEWGILAALIVAGLGAIILGIGTAVNGAFGNINTAIHGS